MTPLVSLSYASVIGAVALFFPAYSLADECDKFNKVSFKEIDTNFQGLDISDQAHELYLYGKCGVFSAKPILKRYKGSQRISHHIQPPNNNHNLDFHGRTA